MKNKNDRWWDIPSIILLVIALWTAALRFRLTDWTDQTFRVEYLAFIACIVGLAFGYSRFRGKTVFWMGLVYTFFFIPWQLGLISNDNSLWLTRMHWLVYRCGVVIWQIINNKPVQDPIFFLTLMMFIFWTISFTACYRLIRYGAPWVPLFFGALGIFLIENYHPYLERNALYSGFYVLLCLLLIGRLYYLKSRENWLRKGVMVDPETGFDLGRGVVIAGFALVLVAWNMPRLTDNPNIGVEIRESISREWQKVRDRFSNAVQPLRGSAGPAMETLGDDFGLGSGGPLSDDLVFSVESEAGLLKGSRYYWRGRTYDYYANGTWSNSPADSRLLRPNLDKLQAMAGIASAEVTLKFNSFFALTRTVHIPASPVSVSRTVEALVVRTDDGHEEVISVSASPSIRAGEFYVATSKINLPTVEQLRAAGTDYPQWVRERYLSYPESLPKRVVDLAQRVAGQGETPFDKALLVTNFLRDQMKYSETVPRIPQGRDPVDWFLFDLREGFCNYYATAEVMLLRTLGVPARLAVGYAEGVYDSEAKVFNIRRKDAHAWPEVYFPGIGWIEFEPTVSQPGITRPSDEERIFDSSPVSSTDPYADELFDDVMGGVPFAQALLEAQRRERIIWTIVTLFGLALAGFAYYRLRKIGFTPIRIPVWVDQFLERKGLRSPGWLKFIVRQVNLSPMERMFYRLGWYIRLMGGKVEAARTPTEQMEMLVQFIPQATRPAAVLLNEYHRVLYSRYPANILRASDAAREIQRSFQKAFFERFFRRRKISSRTT